MTNPKQYKVSNKFGPIVIRPSLLAPKYEHYTYDRKSENLEVNKPSDIFEDEESREALESVIDSILTQAGCGSAASLDVVHHRDGTETWTLTAYADGLSAEAHTKKNALILLVTIAANGFIKRAEGMNGYAPSLNSRIDAQGFLDFVRNQAVEYVASQSANTNNTDENNTDKVNVLDTFANQLSYNLREFAQQVALSIETMIQTVGADYVIDLTKVYSSPHSTDALATYTGNFLDKNKRPKKITVVIGPYNGVLTMVIYVDDILSKTLRKIQDAEGLADWVRDNVAYRMNEGRRLCFKRLK